MIPKYGGGASRQAFLTSGNYFRGGIGDLSRKARHCQTARPIVFSTMQIERPNKRARVVPGTDGKATKPPSTARLFAPFRALGFISNDVPFALQVRSAKGALKGPNVNILSCLGRSWAMWDAGKMNLLFVGALTPCHWHIWY